MLDRKELKKQDVFVSRLSLFFRWLQTHPRVWIGVLASVAALAGVFILVKNYREAAEEKAASAIYKLQSEFEKSVTKGADWEPKSEAAIKKLLDVARSHRGRYAAYAALMLIGDAYFDHQNYSKAAEYYREARDSSPNKQLSMMATHSIGYALESNKEYDNAVVEFEKVIASKTKSLRSDTLLALARIAEAKGDKAKALQTYSTILTEFPNSESSKTAEMMKGRLSR